MSILIRASQLFAFHFNDVEDAGRETMYIADDQHGDALCDANIDTFKRRMEAKNYKVIVITADQAVTNEVVSSSTTTIMLSDDPQQYSDSTIMQKTIELVQSSKVEGEDATIVVVDSDPVVRATLERTCSGIKTYKTVENALCENTGFSKDDLYSLLKAYHSEKYKPSFSPTDYRLTRLLRDNPDARYFSVESILMSLGTVNNQENAYESVRNLRSNIETKINSDAIETHRSFVAESTIFAEEPFVTINATLLGNDGAKSIANDIDILVKNVFTQERNGSVKEKENELSEEMTSKNNQIVKAIFGSMLCEADETKRPLLVDRWLDVFEALIAKNNHPAAFAVLGGLNSSNLNALWRYYPLSDEQKARKEVLGKQLHDKMKAFKEHVIALVKIKDDTKATTLVDKLINFSADSSFVPYVPAIITQRINLKEVLDSSENRMKSIAYENLGIILDSYKTKIKHASNSVGNDQLIHAVESPPKEDLYDLCQFRGEYLYEQQQMQMREKLIAGFRGELRRATINPIVNNVQINTDSPENITQLHLADFVFMKLHTLKSSATQDDYTNLSNYLTKIGSRTVLVDTSKLKRLLERVFNREFKSDELHHIHRIYKQAYYRSLIDNPALKKLVEDKNITLKGYANHTKEKIIELNAAIYNHDLSQEEFKKLLSQVGIREDAYATEFKSIWDENKAISAKNERWLEIFEAVYEAAEALSPIIQSSFMNALKGKSVKERFEGVKAHIDKNISEHKLDSRAVKTKKIIDEIIKFEFSSNDIIIHRVRYLLKQNFSREDINLEHILNKHLLFLQAPRNDANTRDATPEEIADKRATIAAQIQQFKKAYTSEFATSFSRFYSKGFLKSNHFDSLTLMQQYNLLEQSSQADVQELWNGIKVPAVAVVVETVQPFTLTDAQKTLLINQELIAIIESENIQFKDGVTDKQFKELGKAVKKLGKNPILKAEELNRILATVTDDIFTDEELYRIHDWSKQDYYRSLLPVELEEIVEKKGIRLETQRNRVTGKKDISTKQRIEAINGAEANTRIEEYEKLLANVGIVVDTDIITATQSDSFGVAATTNVLQQRISKDELKAVYQALNPTITPEIIRILEVFCVIHKATSNDVTFEKATRGLSLAKRYAYLMAHENDELLKASSKKTVQFLSAEQKNEDKDLIAWNQNVTGSYREYGQKLLDNTPKDMYEMHSKIALFKAVHRVLRQVDPCVVSSHFIDSLNNMTPWEQYFAIEQHATEPSPSGKPTRSQYAWKITESCFGKTWESLTAAIRAQIKVLYPCQEGFARSKFNCFGDSIKRIIDKEIGQYSKDEFDKLCRGECVNTGMDPSDPDYENETGPMCY